MSCILVIYLILFITTMVIFVQGQCDVEPNKLCVINEQHPIPLGCNNQPGNYLVGYSRRRDDYWYSPGIGAHKLHLRAVTWNEARKTCQEEGGYLAIINSKTEAGVLSAIFNKTGCIVGSPHPNFAAIGFHDLFAEGDFVTVHGDSLAKAGYTEWAGTQPDNAGGNENCGSIHIGGKLNDINCNTKFGFICELAIC